MVATQMPPAKARATKETGWRCPRCGRHFLHRTREHSCDVRPLAAHLDRASANVRATFAAIQNMLAEIGPHNVVTVKTMIVLRGRRNFGNLVVRRDTLELEFLSTRTLHHPRIHKTDRLAAGKYTHHTRLSSPAEVDREVDAWLREAYELGV